MKYPLKYRSEAGGIARIVDADRANVCRVYSHQSAGEIVERLNAIADVPDPGEFVKTFDMLVDLAKFAESAPGGNAQLIATASLALSFAEAARGKKPPPFKGL